MPFVRDEDHDLFYTWAPAKGDLTLLFIHGLGSSSSFYAPVTSLLLERGYSCLAFDTPGSGISGLGGKTPTSATVAESALTLLTVLGRKPEHTVVVGHSMGALVASELAQRINPLGVVLIGPVHPSPALAGIFDARIKTIEEQNSLEGLANAIPDAATGSASTPIQRAFIRTLILSQTTQGYISLCRLIAGAQAPPYDQIKCPLLIIAGEEDKTSPLASCTHIKESWGCAEEKKQLEILPRVGHWHCIESPEGVAQALGSFVDGLRQGQ